MLSFLELVQILITLWFLRAIYIIIRSCIEYALYTYRGEYPSWVLKRQEQESNRFSMDKEVQAEIKKALKLRAEIEKETGKKCDWDVEGMYSWYGKPYTMYESTKRTKKQRTIPKEYPVSTNRKRTGGNKYQSLGTCTREPSSPRKEKPLLDQPQTPISQNRMSSKFSKRNMVTI